MDNSALQAMKTVFLFFMVIVILFSFSMTAFAASSTDVDETNKLLGWLLPSDDFFPNQFQRLNELVKEKLGGISYLFETMTDFWNSLGTGVRGISFSVPDNYFFKGYKGITVNPLSQATAYINFFRDLFSVFIALITAMTCYKKLVTLFSV